MNIPQFLNVYFNDFLAARLTLGSKREFQFQYLEAWLHHPDAIPFSLKLPFQRNSFMDDESRPFFENLLPESQARRMVAKEFGISEKNIFGVLAAIGGDCAGAVSLWPGQIPSEADSDYRLILDKELEKMILELPKHPLMASKELRLSLAGVQDKLLLYIENNKFYLPTSRKPSSHILKPPIIQFPNTVINEYFCMSLAKLLELPIPEIQLIKRKESLYLIERYDRRKNEKNQLKRIHQEDFCQALGFLSEQKYQSEGGPTLKDCFALVRDHSIQPALDGKNFVAWVVFNYIIGNADAHAKNLALLLTQKGPSLAPFYDILSTEMYPQLSPRMAMKLGGENRPDWIQKRHWERFAEEIGFKFTIIQSVMKSIIEKYAKNKNHIQKILDSAEKEEKTMIQSIIVLIEKRLGRLSKVIV